MADTSPPAPSQRERFRDSLRDAFDGIDVGAIQARAEVPARPAPPMPARPAPPLPPALPPAPLTAGRVTPTAPQPEQLRAAVDAALAPLRAEIAALRAEVARLSERPEGGTGSALIYGGLMLLMLIAGAALALVLRH